MGRGGSGEDRRSLEGHASCGAGYIYISSEEALIALRKVIEEAANHVADIAPGVTFTGVTHEGPPPGTS